MNFPRHNWGEGSWLVIGVVLGLPEDWDCSAILNEFNLLASLNLLQ